MRTLDELERFALQASTETIEPELESYYTTCYEACIPKLFWDIERSHVSHNKGTFDKVVAKYCARRKKAMRHGYSLLFTGDNGVGKTMFISYILTQMIKRGCSVYYTTLPQLDIDIKRGFNDREMEKRLTQYLGCDFIAVDEIGKEHYKSESYLNTRFELLLKTRHDDGDPTLLASNMDYGSLCGMYGASIQSMWDGRYIAVGMESGDFRKTIQARAKTDLGIKL